MSDEKKGSFFDRLKKVVDQAVDQAMATPPAPAWPAEAKPAPSARHTAPIRPESKRTDQLIKTTATGQLPTQGKNTAPLPEPVALPEKPPEEELSPRRLALIDDFLTGQAKLDQMKDPTFMYKVVSDERAYQTQLLLTLKERLDELGTDEGEEAEALRARIQRSQAIVTNLFKVLKYITGKKGRTGGTGFLGEER